MPLLNTDQSTAGPSGAGRPLEGYSKSTLAGFDPANAAQGFAQAGPIQVGGTTFTCFEQALLTELRQMNAFLSAIYSGVSGQNVNLMNS